MVKLPTFENWFLGAIAQSLATCEESAKDILSTKIPPSNLATSYRFMYAFGNHLQMASAKVHLAIIDFGITTTFEQECRSSSSD
jgi:hypothetical protein